jgi:hypothetical protein
LIEDLIGRLRKSAATTKESDALCSSAAIEQDTTEARLRSCDAGTQLTNPPSDSFAALQNNLNLIDFSLLLPDVTTSRMRWTRN